ncbi:Anti-sigma-F factor antagonist RsfA [Mycobacterium simulans]|uniref:Anti-sigma factor antagonist n=1 Tax=Mycobacterium simulans TaxID=627089 RepID=A0A7Z7IJF3_9MYCO|nr:anti-sigma factor antagonist [Mycobacterium simulans]SOJ54638.1 Anti-sigma-F factor antagonist RsfA [Mycobacterium simulans]
MSLVIAESVATPLALSTRLVYELGDPRSTLRATTDRNGEAVLIHTGGEIDACNEDTWRQLVGEAAASTTPPGPFIVDITEVDFMGCCAFAVLADAAERCRRRGIELRLVSRQQIVSRIVSACGLRGVLSTYPTVDAALAARTR